MCPGTWMLVKVWPAEYNETPTKHVLIFQGKNDITEIIKVVFPWARLGFPVWEPSAFPSACSPTRRASCSWWHFCPQQTSTASTNDKPVRVIICKDCIMVSNCTFSLLVLWAELCSTRYSSNRSPSPGPSSKARERAKSVWGCLTISFTIIFTKSLHFFLLSDIWKWSWVGKDVMANLLNWLTCSNSTKSEHLCSCFLTLCANTESHGGTAPIYWVGEVNSW